MADLALSAADNISEFYDKISNLNAMHIPGDQYIILPYDLSIFRHTTQREKLHVKTPIDFEGTLSAHDVVDHLPN